MRFAAASLAARDYAQTIDNVRQALGLESTHYLVIADDVHATGLAGVMGGLTSEIDDNSTAIALEAAHFNATRIARTCRRNKLSSEASRRFERGVDRVLAPYASARATALMLELGGGRYLGMTAVEAPVDPHSITIDAELPGRTGGLPIDRSRVVESLRAVGCTVDDDVDPLVVTAPSWRPDLTDPADLVEEVLRLIGYDEIPSELPVAPAGFGLTARQRGVTAAGRALAGAGFVEVLSYPFVGAADFDLLGLPADDPHRSIVLLANPLSDEQPGMRTTLLPGIVAAARRNVGRGNADLALFEIGSVTRLREGQQPRLSDDPPRPSVEHRPSDDDLVALGALLPEQSRHCAVFTSGVRDRAGWWGPAVPSGWFDVIDAIRQVAESAHQSPEVRRGSAPMPWHPGRCAQLVVNGQVVGHAGELHPRVIEAAGLPPRSAAAEVDLDAVVGSTEVVVSGPTVGTFPVAKEDLAVVVDSQVPVAHVAAALRDGAGSLVESIRLFDVYEGPQVGEGRRSLAFALRLRAPDRTLSVEELSAAREGALAEAAARVGAVLRT